METTSPSETPPPAKKRRRWLRILVLLLVALPLLAVAAGWLALRSPSVRQAVLAKISRSFEASSGIRATAADFTLYVTQGVLELDDVALSIGDAPPFLTAEDLRAEFEWSGLFGDLTVLESVVLERPVTDLRNPLPPPSDEPPPRIDVKALELRDGRLLGEPTADDGEAWLTAWSADTVNVTGSYVDGRVDLRLADSARLRLERTRDGPLELQLASRIAGPLEGPYVVEDLKLVGDNLRLDASGEIGTGEGQPLVLRLDLDADPSLLVTEIGPGGRFRATGEIDLRRWRGDLRLTAQDFPSEALEPWIGEAARPGGRPSRIDLDARFTSDPDAPQQVTGEAELAWRQGERQLVAARITLTDGRLDDDGVVLDSLVGDVHAKTAGLPAELLRPWLGSRNLALLDARGTRLDLEADVVVGAASPSEPEGGLRVVWRRGGEELLRAAARTLDDDEPRLRLDLEATLLPSQPGRRHLAGQLAAASWPELARGELADARLALELPDVEEAADDLARRWPLLLEELGLDLESLPEAFRGAVEATVDAEGPLENPRTALDATWRPDASSSVAVRASGEPMERRGEARLTLENVDLALLPGTMSGRLAGTVEANGSPEDWQATVALDGSDLRYGTEMPTFEELHVEAETDGTWLDLTDFSGRKGESRFAGNARLELALPQEDSDPADARIRSARLHLAADAPFTGVDRVDFDAELRAGVVHVIRLDLEAPTGPGELAAEVPLGALAAFNVDVESWPVEVASGRIKVDLDFPSLDVGALVLDVGQDPPWSKHVASLTGRVWIDPADLTATEGELLVERWLLQVGERRLEVGDDPILLALGERRLDVLPVTLQADGHPFDVEGTVELAAGWTLDDGFERLVSALEARAEGTIDGGLVTPYLAGGVARGPVALSADLSGTIGDLRARIRVDGPKAEVLYASPYVTQLRNPRLEIELADGVTTVSGGSARVNGGPITFDARLSAAGDWTIGARFEGARYRLDYGVTALLNGDLRLELPAEGAGRLSGDVEVDRAVQRRDLRLDREILDVLFGPPDLSGAGGGELDDLELDLELTTARGVWVKNNLADVRGSWSTITVQGTLAAPILQGRIEIDPGGFLYAYGRTARIDRGALIWNGEPGLPPEIDIQQTWDSEDPTIVAGGDTLARLRLDWRPTKDPGTNNTAPGLDDRLAEGLAGYAGGLVGQRLGGARVRIQPVLVFGETDPSAKLVISRDLSSWIAFAVAVDLRDSQRQTYVLDLHKLKYLPRVAFQLFTEEGVDQPLDPLSTEEGTTEGVTVQQAVTFGKGRIDTEDPRLRRISFETVLEGISLKALRGAVAYRKGEPLPDTADFEAEVDVAEHLRKIGYPDARVDAWVEPAGSRADLRIAVAPGPHVTFVFEGDVPPRNLRRSITEPYRVDFYEQASLGEVREQAVRALRSQGYLEPRVETEVEVESERRRIVRIRGSGGRKVSLDRLRFRGVDAATASLLESRFSTRVARVELAAGLPRAEEWLLRNLRSLGYPEARLAGRRITEDGQELVVETEPGERLEIVEVRIEGLPEAEAGELRKRLPLRPGEVPRSDLVAAGNLLIRNDLKRRGYAEAEVRTKLEEVEAEPSRRRLLYRVEPGPQYRLDGVRVAGLDSTNARWATRIAELGEGAVLDPNAVGAARSRLFATRLFRSVRSSTERTPDGLARVTFEIDEAPRYQLSYGIRWENDTAASSTAGSSLVVDLVDRNALGRGITLGLRGLYGDRDRAGRLYGRRSGLLGRRLALEVYVERRHEETRPTQEDFDDSFLIDTLEGSVQAAFPIGELTSQVYGRFKEERIREKVPFFPDFPFDETIRFPFVGWQLFYDGRDDRLDPRRGIFASVDLSTTDDYIGSDFDFIRVFSQIQWTRPAFRLGSRQLTWAQSYRVGYISGAILPPDETFESGGERSLRGYRRVDVGTGQALLVINQELRVPLWQDQLTGVVFFDVGNVWDGFGDFGSELLTSAGLGVRAASPIGLLRLDFGVPLDRDDGESPVKVYFGFGHAF